jgi:hypothetical protein
MVGVVGDRNFGLGDGNQALVGTNECDWGLVGEQPDHCEVRR